MYSRNNITTASISQSPLRDLSTSEDGANTVTKRGGGGGGFVVKVNSISSPFSRLPTIIVMCTRVRAHIT